MYIDYKKYRDELLSCIAKYGFTERKDKTSKNNRVFTNGNETIIVPLKDGRYNYFSSPNNNRIFGDTVAFVSYMEFGHTNPKGTELERIVSVLGDNGVISKPVSNTAIKEVISTPLDIISIELQPLKTNKVPYYCTKLFEARGLSTTLPTDFASSFGTFQKELPDGRKFEQLGFLWKNANDECVGIQNKYIDANGACQKRFVVNSDRGNSLFITDVTDKKYLFVCEDPFDALAHRQLYCSKSHASANLVNDTAYVCTGGSMTTQQTDLIRQIVTRMNAILVLGNDNDIAGQASNFKLADTLGLYDISYKNDRAQIREKNSDKVIADCDLNNLKDFIVKIKNHRDIFLSVPQGKDWNDDLRLNSDIKKSYEKLTVQSPWKKEAMATQSKSQPIAKKISHDKNI